MAGQNIGTDSAGDRTHHRYAAEIKELVRALSDFTSDELRQIPLVFPGDRLKQGATYLDLSADDREPFTATGDMRAPEGHWLADKSQTPYEYWNRLLHTQTNRCE